MHAASFSSSDKPFGRGFEALALCVMVVLVTGRAWGELWFGPEFGKALEHLFSRTPPLPPSTAERFSAYWQFLLPAAALACGVTVLIRSKWMRVASMVWCGSVAVFAAVLLGAGRPTGLAIAIVLSALATTVGVEMFRVRAA